MGWVVNATPRPLYPWERPGTRCGWAPGPVYKRADKSRPRTVQPVASRYTDSAILAPTIHLYKIQYQTQCMYKIHIYKIQYKTKCIYTVHIYKIKYTVYIHNSHLQNTIQNKVYIYSSHI